MTLEVVSPTEALLDGRYLLQGPVGKGGMATVYRAEDTHLGRTVAIKMIHEGENAFGSTDRAHTEKTLLASLSHPSLVTLFDAQLEPKRPQYLVMELVDGPTLAERMATGPIPAGQLAGIARDLAEGLAAVHSAGIVHRDVKPSNVLLAPRSSRSGSAWTAKLADFGIAYTLGDSRLTSPGMVLGTLTYMAPEQLTDADPGTPVDVFALGLVLIEALTGEPAYPVLGTGRAAAIARVGTPPSIPDSVDADWRSLLERMTRLEPAERPTAHEVARTARYLARDTGRHDAPLLAAGAGADAAGADPAGTGTDAAAAGAAAAGAAAAHAGADAAAEPVSPAQPSRRDTMVQPTAPTTGATAIMAVGPPASASSTRRHRVLIGAAALVVAGIVAVGASALIPPAEAAARTAETVAVRTTPIEPSTEPADTTPVTDEQPAVEPATNQGNQGKSDKAKPDKAKPDKPKPDKPKSDKKPK
ncbi:serine/threonine-protein kinase [Microbacterium sp. W4I20]|uniref:serine/threonine-protein kinase n=1 Tax=Microbacterium sp. W4I20 TaxID=3042262 RepID=UPI0027899072|nr:serine/threonine-protein kinase [Microbacterium sp. W4I20]MDQ0727305.1 hypothetical protein [Microbacterium sp. W4I20]